MLLPLAILFFIIMLLEIDLGHRAALAQQQAWLALVPVVWLPLSLLSLIAVEVLPSKLTASIAQLIMAVAAAVGVVGSAAHMTASGVNMDSLARLFSSAVWGGPASPNWPISIAIAALIGFGGATGVDKDTEFLRRGDVGLNKTIAFILVVLGCAFAVVPAMEMASAVCLAIAALLLLVELIAMLVAAAKERNLQ